MNAQAQPHVVIVGAGFGGMNTAKALRRAPVRITLINRRNYHLFQPLLYQVATAGIAPSEIAYPVRAIFRNQANFQFLLAEVSGVDFSGLFVETSAGPVPYDYLVLAVGGQTNFFGLDSVASHGFELKDIDDAEAIRNHVLRMFERSVYEVDPEVRVALRTFVVVGGGPTGVEYAGALMELINLVLVKDFPNLTPQNVHVIILEMLPRLLASFPEELSRAASARLQEKGVDVRCNVAVAGYDGRQVFIKGGQSIPAYSLLWAAGVRAETLADQLEVAQGRQGRLIVLRTLQLPEHPNVFVIGDAAYLEEEGEPLPLVAPVAIQQAKMAARNILHLVRKETLEDFDYKDPGSLATIGRAAAVARIGRFKFQGFFAWIVWLVVHLFWLIGFRNRLLVLINWMWDYFLFERAVRLITPYSKKA